MPMAAVGEYLFDMMSGQAIARPSGMLCSAIATASFSPIFIIIFIFILQKKKGTLCIAMATASFSPISIKYISQCYYNDHSTDDVQRHRH
jgi:hypothetical protein